jgi:hypothetical protein
MGLDTAAAAEFDQHHAIAKLIGHFFSVLIHDPLLGFRQIVFFEMANLIKQLRATFIVEVLAEKPLFRLTESPQDIVEKLLIQLFSGRLRIDGFLRQNGSYSNKSILCSAWISIW